ncbi:hypothetical protein PHYSODRAFT_323186 [Phytophthora sojae]|uniref:MULE transposase domain-containing protein n=1 Tax=Phytophthora sojae (strain P6497) TaxID=1094619 RepID=G4YHX1_PHYSP|nr:hypothetical protein PHYSODRAFT_323186 [Phytophthora sojae]EGZ29698.1 hypothetical protein PHYSODRAFT_323186 [Phytophthora sojae]|eukprot:XP_009516973.1 hypothetical protein PHYSODRAFT_323186 [Phytophthora sojae]
MPTTTASTPTSSSHRSDGEFDQQWEFGFNSDRGGASDDDSDDEDSPTGTPPRDIEVDDDSVSSGGSSVSTQGDVTRLPGGLVLGSSRYDMDDSEASSSLDDSDAYDPEMETVSSEDEGDELAVQPSASGRQGHAGIDLVATAHRTVIQLNGRQYTKARESSRKISLRCSSYRRTPGCKGKVDYSFARDVFYNFTPHTCEGTGQAPSRYVDVTEEMKAEFHHVFMEGERLQRVLGWADPRLLELLRYPGSQMFVDGTFRCVPRSFYQCVVLMVSDAASGVFVPCVYALTTGKTHQLYQKLMRFMDDGTGSRLQPGSVVCDFEAALIDSVTDLKRPDDA